MEGDDHGGWEKVDRGRCHGPSKARTWTEIKYVGANFVCSSREM